MSNLAIAFLVPSLVSILTGREIPTPVDDTAPSCPRYSAETPAPGSPILVRGKSLKACLFLFRSNCALLILPVPRECASAASRAISAVSGGPAGAGPTATDNGAPAFDTFNSYSLIMLLSSSVTPRWTALAQSRSSLTW